MSFDKKIKEVDEACEKAIGLIKEKHSGANLNEAKSLLFEAGEALKADELDRSIELATKAQIAAKPTTEYLLSKAKELVFSAENCFKSKNYEEAVENWEKSIEEYERAGVLANERNEKEVVERIAEVEKTINENIFRAKTAIDNQKMLELVDRGNRKVEEANKLFLDKKFDESKKDYEGAKDIFKEALLLCENRDFENEKEKIKEAIESIDSSINAVLLSTVDAMLKDAKESFKEKNFSKSEEAFLKTIKFISELDIQKKELEEMLEQGKAGKIQSMIEIGKKKMKSADMLFEKVKYYDAKESYKASREYLEDVRDEASSYKLTKLVEDLNELIQACSQNISSATTALMDVGDVGPIEIITCDDVGKGVARFKSGPINSFVPPTPVAEKLRKKYSKLVYLGGGGFADVYKATKKDGTVVSVKAPRNLDERAESIFFRELDTWKKLKHRNIVKFIKPYVKPEPHFEIEYVDGGSLYEALKKDSFDVEVACRIVFDIASGLEYGHSKNIIHGDINPKNILLNSIGEAKITDFGLSKIATSSSELKGYTLPYAPIEMFEEGTINEKSDVYQLGLTFYVMLTRINPFDAGSRFETERQIKTLTPDPPGNSNHKVKGLDDIIMRSLLKDPKKRPSLREFREQIYDFLKKNYSESLHLTENTQKIISITSRHAMLAAKIGDTSECLSSLNSVKGKIKDPDIRQEITKLIEQVEFRTENDIPLDQILDKIEIFLKKIEWGEECLTTMA